MGMLDPHSYADDSQPSTSFIDLDLYVDFKARDLAGTVTLELDRPCTGVLDLDTRDLAIQSIVDGTNKAVPFELSAPDPIKGSRLRLTTHETRVTIRYRTSPSAVALQWLSPQQTRGQNHPYVFTQCQPIHARSILPCQDTARIRCRYAAKLDIPSSLQAVMAAAHKQRIDAGTGRVIELFEMPQPIPTYLFAFAVGRIDGRDIGPRSRVYAEPETLDQAAWELASVDAILSTAEGLFGEYGWDRYDLLVMPPSFPYGGMENPRLTFLTPTVLAGDRSLVNVVAHELAHSWTGNLVTNASMNDFWLNEGFTVYAERRILEALDGQDAVALHAALGRKHLEIDLARLNRKNPALTRLKTDLSGISPDEVYSLVPYEKGYLFLRRIEEVIGRQRFDTFLRAYISNFSFQSITTEDFVRFFESEVPDAAQKIGLEEWIYGTGIPAAAPETRSESLDKIDALVNAHAQGTMPSAQTLAGFGPIEWQVFLSSLPKRMSLDDCRFLDSSFHLSAQKNAEIRVAWLTIAATSAYAPAYPRLRETLIAFGRMKYLRPLYTALVEQGERGRTLAAEIYRQASVGYHPVARSMVEGLLGRS